MRTYMRFCAHLKLHSLYIYRSGRFFKQKCREKLHTHFTRNIIIPRVFDKSAIYAVSSLYWRFFRL